MPLFAQSPAESHKRMTRRHTLILPVLAAAGGALAGCDIRKARSANGSGSNSARPPRTGSTDTAARATGSHGGAALETAWEGKTLSVEVGPAVVKEKHTVVPLNLSTNSEEKISMERPFSTLFDPYSMSTIQMLSLNQGLAFRQLNQSTEGLIDGVRKGKPLKLFAVFAATSDTVKTVEMFLPSMGVVTNVPVVKETDADFKVDEALAGAKLDSDATGPFRIETATISADGSADTKKDEKSTTVTVSGDVTFAVDSDQLSAQADSVLSNVVEQIKRYPSGGQMSVVGHTDDVQDDSYNQGLSERRAQAVAARLKALTDLSKWKQSVSGQGESAPRVSNDSDEHRQINRRVEITLTPSKPDEANTAGTSSSAAPSAEASRDSGPTGKGSEGVDVTIDNKKVHLSIDHVIRVGKYLAGTVLLKADQDVTVKPGVFALPYKFQELRWPSLVHGVYNFTLLNGGTRYLEADHASQDGDRFPIANSVVNDIKAGEAMRLPAVWPDTGEDAVTLDLPHGDNSNPAPPLNARLTDIPVTEA